jgi:hypothetical protein
MIRHRMHDDHEAIVAPDCPMCGVSMVEEDRVRESGHIYVWYACSKTGCGGQWLSQIPAPERFRNRSMEIPGLRACPA